MKKLIVSCLFFSSIASATEYGRVQSVTPSYKDVTVPQQHCTQYQEKSSRFNYGTIVGAIAGGMIGKQIGDGGTNAIATLIGTGAGAIIGQEVASKGYETKQQCGTVYKTHTEAVGYNVTVNYKGVLIPTHLKYNPGLGSLIPVTITSGE